MKRFDLIAMIALCGLMSSAALAEQDAPVNAMCPIGKEPIVASAGTVKHKEHTIGICCPGCAKAFLAWDVKRRDAFVALALRSGEPGQADDGHRERSTAPAAATSRPATGTAAVAPYALDVCIVAGGKLGSMGDPVVKQYDGREVRFCCAGCIGKFEADKAGYFKKIDELIVKDQLRYYPLTTCVVTGEPLIENGKDIATNMIDRERLVRLCGKGCVREFNADPAKFMGTLDKAVADAQRKDYPLDTCVVMGSPLGSMGDPTEMVVAGRLLRFCCAGCEPKVKADPAKYLDVVDKAWQAKGRPAVGGN